jgi:hypothetical protein
MSTIASSKARPPALHRTFLPRLRAVRTVGVIQATGFKSVGSLWHALALFFCGVHLRLFFVACTCGVVLGVHLCVPCAAAIVTHRMVLVGGGAG